MNNNSGEVHFRLAKGANVLSDPRGISRMRSVFSTRPLPLSKAEIKHKLELGKKNLVQARQGLFRAIHADPGLLYGRLLASGWENNNNADFEVFIKQVLRESTTTIVTTATRDALLKLIELWSNLMKLAIHIEKDPE